MLYFDNAATTRMYPEVLNAMLPWMTEQYANPSAEYKFGREARKAVDGARETIAGTLGVTPEHIIFTSGGSEGNTAVMRYFDKYAPIVCSDMEHPSILRNQRYSNMFHGGPEEFKAKLKSIKTQQNWVEYHPRVSVMWVNNETGDMNDIEELALITHAWRGQFHTDAVQGYGSYDARDIAQYVDFLTASAHKFHGPKGVGFIYVKDPAKFAPLIKGGGQENGLRSGTENVAGIVGMAKAAQMADDAIKNGTRLREYADRIREGLAPVAERFNGNSDKIISVTLKGVESSAMVLALGEQDVCVSAGSACHSNSDEPSHVLKAIGLTDDQARRTIRISLSNGTTSEDVDGLIGAVVGTAKILRGGI